MFDVLWTDPNRELVGERLMRKELESRSKDKDKEKSENGRRPTSTSSSSSSDRGFGFSPSTRRAKTPIPSQAKNLATTPDILISDNTRGKKPSIYGVRALLSRQDDSEPTANSVKPAVDACLPVQLSEPGDATSSLSSRGMKVVVFAIG
jgi:hypothetical protein